MDGLMGGDPEFEPLPPYSDPRMVLRRALKALRPAADLSVIEVAERDMMINTAGSWLPFRREVAPYMTEPTNMLATRGYRGLVFCGPARSGKTVMLKCGLTYAITNDPGRIALFTMTRDAAAEFERDELSPMVRNSPRLRERVALGRGADNLYQKLYVGGTHLSLDYPVSSKVRSRSLKWILATEFDDFGEAIQGEGDPYTQFRGRTQNYFSRGLVAVESSPNATLTDESWRAKSVHDSPPVSHGVLLLYPEGTRGRWYWPCPGCGAVFEPHFDRLIYPDSVDPVEAGQAALMRCPHCHDAFGHELKRELNAEGFWLHETAEGKTARIDSGEARRTDLVSYWLNGAAAAFSTWADLVADYLNGLRRFEITGDEAKLRAAVNIGQGAPYLPRASSSASEIGVDTLRDKAKGNKTPKGVAPPWARYITVSIDVQATRFPVGVTAWGEDGRHQPIDRFDLITPPGQTPGEDGRALNPFEVAEDWTVIEALETRTWRVEGTDWTLRALALTVDQQGGGATTDNAYSFYRGRKRAGSGSRWFISRGRGGLKHPDRVWLKAPESASGKRRVAKDVLTLNMATDSLKDAVVSSLRLTEPGQNHCAIPEWMEDAHLLEFTAERRTVKGWEPRPGMKRNESLDHLVMARALHIWTRAERIRWDAPPPWAQLTDTNPHAVWVGPEKPVEPDTDENPTQARAVAGRTISAGNWIDARKDWL